ncbi:MAG: hypothetical protein KatS3mg105_3350 [Gemmatales bacterium]|nr:MAG: hypothetical protein KatS3mg105_3350 [Gemmatales bacterium]
MKHKAPPTRPDMGMLFRFFPQTDDIAEFELLPGDDVPEPYHGLLVHEHHMTVTVEKFYGDLVDVHIIAKHHDNDDYARKILLSLQKTGQVVQYGIMRILFRYCSDIVRDEIVAGRTPLGRILIQHDVLRRIEPTHFLRVVPGKDMMNWFNLCEPKTTYGRLAYIHCNEQPAVELLEILAPV